MANKLLKYRIENWLKNNRYSRESISYKNAKRIGVLFTIDSIIDKDSLKKINVFIKKIESENKLVNSLVYLTNPNKSIIEFPYFNKKNISFWGNYNAHSVSSFIDQPFDYLFHLDEDPHLEVKGILAQSKAKCRVGLFDKDDEPFFELMINPSNSDYLSELYNYVSKLS